MKKKLKSNLLPKKSTTEQSNKEPMDFVYLSSKTQVKLLL